MCSDLIFHLNILEPEICIQLLQLLYSLQSRTDNKPQPTKKVFLGGLSFDSDDDTIKEALKLCGCTVSCATASHCSLHVE